MKFLRYFLTPILTFLLLLSNAYAVGDGILLEERWQLETAKPLSTYHESTLKVLQERHVLFVAGIMNGISHVPRVSGYFGTAMDVVLNTIHMGASYFGPWSSVSTTDNVKPIYDEIVRVYEEVRKPLILVAHSKGAAEVLLTVLNHPLLLLDSHPMVDRVVLIQGAIGGSVLAEPEKRGWLMALLARYFDGGVRSLTRSQAHKNFEEAYEVFEDRVYKHFWYYGKKGVKKISEGFAKRIFYVRGAYGALPLSPALRITLGVCGQAHLCETSGMTNDGLLDVEDQIFYLKDGTPFGVDLGILRADHVELVVNGYFVRSKEEFRESFMRAVLEQIFQY